MTGTPLYWESEYGLSPKHPAYRVSHTDATEFCVKFSALLKSIPEASGMSASLPTEAQWEYACRAGTTTRYYWGDDESKLGDYAWYSGNSKGGTQPVGQKLPNKWGLCDMVGSVWEMCGDRYAEKLPGGVDPHGPANGSLRSDRGGCWYFSFTGNFRSARRSWNLPSSRIINLGFRLTAVPEAR